MALFSQTLEFDILNKDLAMEKPSKDLKHDKAAVHELDVYFNSLLKSQQEKSNNSSVRIVKLFSMLFLIFVICVSLYLAVSFYMNSSSPAPSDSATAQNQGAYFDPERYLNRSRNISGKISKSFNSSTDETIEFELLDQNGKNLAYIFSETNDLNLSIGLNVEIQGELIRSTADGKEVIKVSSIKLK